MNVTKLLVVVFIAALFGNVGARQIDGVANDTKLMDQKLRIGDVFEDIGNSTNNVIDSIITMINSILGNNAGPINMMIPTIPAPSPDGGLVGVVPSLAPEEGVTNGTEAPLSGGIVELAPSPLLENGATKGPEVPLCGGIIGVVPVSECRAAPTTNDAGAPNGGIVGVEGGVHCIANNFGKGLIINAKGIEDGSNCGSGREP